MKSVASPRGPNGTNIMQPIKHDPPKIGYSIREACQASSLGRTKLYNHISAGRHRAVRLGGRPIISAEELHAVIAGEARDMSTSKKTPDGPAGTLRKELGGQLHTHPPSSK